MRSECPNLSLRRFQTCHVLLLSVLEAQAGLIHFDDIFNRGRSLMSELPSRMLLRAMCAFAALIVTMPHFADAQNASVAPAPKTTDQAFKNIQILKGIP